MACRQTDTRFRGNDGRGPSFGRSRRSSGPSPRLTPKRNGGRRFRRPPLSLGPLVWPVKARPPFPGRFRPRPCGPGRSLRFPHRTSPDRSPAGSAPGPKAGHGSLAGSEISARRHRYSVPYRTSAEANFIGRPFAKPSARGLPVSPDPRRKVGSALACAAASRFFLPVARDLASNWPRSEDFSRSSAGPWLRTSFPFPEGRALPQAS